jgi:hypothetical protein
VTVAGITELTTALPVIAGFATEVAVIVIAPGPVAETVGTPPDTVSVPGPAIVHVTVWLRVTGFTTALAVKVPPGATVATLGVTVMEVIRLSGPRAIVKSANFVGSATDVARTTVLPVTGDDP